jgi:hypothetical protein
LIYDFNEVVNQQHNSLTIKPSNTTMKLITIIILTLAKQVSADFSSAFTTSYIASDITSKMSKQINKKLNKNRKQDHTEVILSDCHTIITPPTEFERDIVIPMETANYQKKMENAHNDTRFNWKSKFSRCDNKLSCNYKIINPHADLAITFIINLIIMLGLSNMVCVCFCGTEKDREELAGVLCGTFCHALISSLLDDEE